MIMISSIGGPSRPAMATSAPSTPRKREPKMTEKLRMLPPGSIEQSAEGWLNCSGVSQRRSSTITRCDHASTPPKPHSAMVAKATNSAKRLGGGGCGDDAVEGAAEARVGDDSFMPLV